jgi:hypothetical protein
MMTLTLSLPSDLEQRLTAEADRQNVAPAEWVVRLLEKHLPPNGRGQELVSLIQSWIDDDDEEEQKQTGDYLIQALDEDRLSERKLYPPELEGVSW